MDASNSRHSSPLSLLSSPLSERSRSPSLPCDYPSPSLTGSRSPSKSREVPIDSIECDGPPPSKKRKLVEPKLRTTEYLDLRALEETLNGKQNAKEEEQLQRLLTMLRKKRKIVVIAGAGISVSAGSMCHCAFLSLLACSYLPYDQYPTSVLRVVCSARSVASTN
jgi:NAD+-dependent protein deacetylase SIR2